MTRMTPSAALVDLMSANAPENKCAHPQFRIEPMLYAPIMQRSSTLSDPHPEATPQKVTLFRDFAELDCWPIGLYNQNTTPRHRHPLENNKLLR
jgi:hypothetical protein